METSPIVWANPAKIFENKESRREFNGVTDHSRLNLVRDWKQTMHQVRLIGDQNQRYLFKEHPLTQPERTDTHNSPHNSPHTHFTLVSNE